MSTIVEVDEAGELKVPGALLPEAAPHTQYSAAIQGDSIIISLKKEKPSFWDRATPQERAAAIRKLAKTIANGPGLPDSAVGRDAIYE